MESSDVGREAPRIGLRYGARTIAGLGEPFVMRDDESLQPVKFEDGTYAIITVNTERGGRVSTKLLKSSDATVDATLNGSAEMPCVGLGAGSGVLRIYGRDADGPFVVKIYGNDKAGRPPEVRR